MTRTIEIDADEAERLQKIAKQIAGGGAGQDVTIGFARRVLQMLKTVENNG